MTDFNLPEDFTPVQITTDDLTFGELDRFAEISGQELGAGVPVRLMLKTLGVLALERSGIAITFDELDRIKIGKVIDMEYYAAEAAKAGKADPTVAGA